MTQDPGNLPAHEDIRRILVIRWSAMGDIVISTAVFEDIFRAFPGREIHLNTMSPWDRLFADDPRFARVFTVDMRGSERGMRGIRRWLRGVRDGHYDLVIDLQNNDRSRILLSLAQLTGARIRYRASTSLRYPYNLGPPDRGTPTQAIECFRGALRAAGIPVVTERPVLHFGAPNRERAARLLAAHGIAAGEFAVFMPGSQAGGHLKRWGAQRYAALAQRLHADGVAHVLLIGARDELDECQAIETACGPYVVNLAGQTEILDIVPICADARFVVANDTGTAHVASATGRPMVMICGPTDPRRVKPAGDNVVALQADLPCINCYGKECSHHSCMEMITPARVHAALAAMDTRLTQERVAAIPVA